MWGLNFTKANFFSYVDLWGPNLTAHFGFNASWQYDQYYTNYLICLCSIRGSTMPNLSHGKYLELPQDINSLRLCQLILLCLMLCHLSTTFEFSGLLVKESFISFHSHEVGVATMTLIIVQFSYCMPNSLVCRWEASATQNVISEIVIVVHRDLAINITRIWYCTVVGTSGLQRMRVV